MAKMSVALLGPALGAVSGVSTHLNQLFSSQLATDFELRHFQVGREGRRESSIARVGRLILSPIAFAGYLLRTRPDLVHLNTSINPKAFWRDLGYLLVARVFRRKTVYQVHGGELPQEFSGNRQPAVALVRWAIGLPQAIVLLAHSEVAAYRKFVPAARVELIANAIEIPNIDHTKSRTPTGTPLRLAYVGRLIKEKGIFEILEAVSVLRGRGRSVTLSYAGDGPDAAALRMSAAESEIGHLVTFVGSVFGDSKSKFWSEADVFVFPTFHPEGLPYALLESMAFGVVPITTAVGAIPDVVDDGVHGLLVPPKDPQAMAAAIERLDCDRALLQRMSLSGQQRIRERFTVTRMASEFRTLYNSL